MTDDSPTSRAPADWPALAALAEREQHAGRLSEAAAAYRRLLAIRPDLAEAHNNLGLILWRQAERDQAVASFRRALDLQPDLADAHHNLGNAFLAERNYAEAAVKYRQVIALRPDQADAYNSLGAILRKQGRLAEAAALFERALALRPGFARAASNLGNVLRHEQRFDEAVIRYRQALAADPECVDAHYNLGKVLAHQGDLGQAAAHFEHVLAVRPDHSQALNSLGNVLVQQQEFDKAIARFQQAVALRPDYAEAHNNLALALREQGQVEEAVRHLRQAIVHRPDFATAHHNLGDILADLGQLDQASESLRRALALRPDYAEVHNNLANLLFAQGKFDDAAVHFRTALSLKPGLTVSETGLAVAEMGLAVTFLIQGDFQRGWPAYEARLRLPKAEPQPRLPRWQGEPLAGRSLLLLSEQGLGDTIHFLRYARAFKALGARVILAAQPALGRLLAAHPDLDELFLLGSAGEMPRTDFYLPLLSAPGALGTTASTIPAEVPYLWAEPALDERWRQELARIEGLKIGIVWQGWRGYAQDRWRSIPLADFAPLAHVPGVQLISLQKGFGSEQIAKVDFSVLDLADRLDEAAGPLMDTAAVIRNLDLVVAADTAVAHLAGALGAPVLLALHYSSDWRWLRDRDDSPWYPTMRLFRQTTLGDWSGVFQRMAQAVRERLALQA